ncbi:MAG: sigma-70 family RNA polymerase sigma factor [Cyclobacteriaceae bacterium]|nr:sigma-70 family RNA polymerase sigma factor [Cyclobacteriaceae bacterium]MCH8517144.1 sigma-70 family RNA polymerase sigma factor [Cyclobacteriaceae bacterium]
MQNKEFVEILEENKQIIYKICRAYSKDEWEMEDLFQEASYQVWKSMKNFEGRSKLSTWIYRITLNVCLGELNKSKRKIQTTQIDNPNIWVDESNNDEEQVAMLYAALKKLSKTDRALIMLFLDDKSYKEMAEILGISTSHVGVKLLRAKKELKRIIDGK